MPGCQCCRAGQSGAVLLLGWEEDIQKRRRSTGPLVLWARAWQAGELQQCCWRQSFTWHEGLHGAPKQAFAGCIPMPCDSRRECQGRVVTRCIRAALATVLCAGASQVVVAICPLHHAIHWQPSGPYRAPFAASAFPDPAQVHHSARPRILQEHCRMLQAVLVRLDAW